MLRGRGAPAPARGQSVWALQTVCGRLPAKPPRDTSACRRAGGTAPRPNRLPGGHHANAQPVGASCVGGADRRPRDGAGHAPRSGDHGESVHHVARHPDGPAAVPAAVHPLPRPDRRRRRAGAGPDQRLQQRQHRRGPVPHRPRGHPQHPDDRHQPQRHRPVGVDGGQLPQLAEQHPRRRPAGRRSGRAHGVRGQGQLLDLPHGERRRRPAGPRSDPGRRPPRPPTSWSATSAPPTRTSRRAGGPCG